MNTGTAKPFSKFGNLVTSIQHPGIEAAYAFNWKTKARHDWYQEFKVGYFYHRFVQHAIPVYTDLGYRYKFSPKWSAQAVIGAGYMHSIPATAQLKLQDDGTYKKGKGIGRSQGIAIANIGIAHVFRPEALRPLKVFITYQQMLQTPFINSYVPLLPYNTLLVGIGIQLKSK